MHCFLQNANCSLQSSINFKTILIKSSEIAESDEIAIEGVALLRVSEMDAFGGEE